MAAVAAKRPAAGGSAGAEVCDRGRGARLARSLTLAGALLCSRILAEVTPGALFTDGAVLQRDKPVAVWGSADPGEEITVTFAGQTREVTAGPDRRWIVFLDPLPANAAGADLLIAGRNTVIVRDVVVGEVWLCSGQSNMEWPVSRAQDAELEIGAADFPLLRHVRIERAVADTPADTVPTSGWKAASPATVGEFTAVGYFFAREIHRKLGVPVGLVHASWGGTRIEPWLSPAALAADPAFAIVRERWDEVLREFPARRQAHEEALAEWSRREAAARAGGAEALAAFHEQNPRPRPPRGPGDPWTPAGLFNGMINPLLPYGLRGFLWYQGENNTDRPAEYHALFTALITGWRGHFGQGDVSFYWVNLAAFGAPTDPTGRAYAFLREAQTRALALPNTGQAVAIDLGDPKDVHPRNKQEVGRRLALLAKNRDYGIIVDDTGPTFRAATREDRALRVTFDHVAGGLVAREKPPQALEIAGPDGVFHPAEGRIERDTLLVHAPQVREPVAVRYAWTNAPEANLFNGAGLPAVPFRSDDW